MSASQPIQALGNLLKVAGLSLLAFCTAGTVMAANPLAIPDGPLFLNVSAKPNLIMAIDDSGSMDTEILLPSNDGAAWWRTGTTGTCTGTGFLGCSRNADGTSDVGSANSINFYVAGGSDGTWKKFTYLFPNGASSGNTDDRRRLTDSTNDHFAVPPIGAYAWMRSPRYNAMYFDPTETYRRWPDGGDYTFDDTVADPTNAKYDPVYGTRRINLTRDFAANGGVDSAAACTDAAMAGVALADNFYFKTYTGMTIPTGACVRFEGWASWERIGHGADPDATSVCAIGVNNGCLSRNLTGAGTDRTRTVNSGTRVAIRYFPATVYLQAATGGIPGFTGTAPADGVAPDGTALYRYEIKPGNFPPDGVAYRAAIQNFANWFTYYRKRHMALRAGLGLAFDTVSSMRIDGFKISDGRDVTMVDIDTAAGRSYLYNNFYYNWTGSGGTPNKNAMANLIRNFNRSNSGAPIIASCQRNYGMLFTDGFSDPNGGSNLANIDGATGTFGRGTAPYTDGASNTMADHAMSAYVTRMPSTNPNLFPAGRVVSPPACAVTPHNPALDCNTNLHMNFYAVTLGARGILFDPDADPPQNAYTNNPAWPETFPTRHPSAVDDLWHATINGRGQLLNAGKASELATRLGQVLNSIVSAEGSASAAAVNSGSINSETRVFQASFSTSDWSGQLRAYHVQTDGSLAATPVLATVPATRQIFTSNPDTGFGAGVPFQWSELDQSLKDILNTNLPVVAGNGQALLNYIRGNRLGDIVNSAPVFVGAPPYRYPDNLPETLTAPAKPYSAFRADQAARQRMVYVGANDGMLHAFSVAPGPTGAIQEAFAYVPRAVYNNLTVLDDPPPAHKFSVDGTVAVVDAFFGGDWHSVLVGGLNNGGKGIYALDVTDPTDIGEASADDAVLWEITNQTPGFSDLGYTYSRPTIARLKLGTTGKWVAIFGNGYDSPGAASAFNGRAVLYIVDVETGALLKSIDVTAGAGTPAPTWRNGLSTPAVVDLNGDGSADYIYAGDLTGNMWKFDVTGTTTGSWDVAYKTPANVPVPLFRAGTTQPITSRPQVGPGPNGIGMVVLFGTGKYLETSDKIVAGASTQAFYGIYDDNRSSATFTVPALADLQQQTVNATEFVTAGGQKVRVTSDNAVAAIKRGWYMNLPLTGERQVSDPVLRNGAVVFTTMRPSTDECAFGGSSWLMTLNLLTGARLPYSPYDLNGQNQFNDDLIDTNNDGIGDTPASGLGNDEILSRPAFVSGPDAEFAFTTDTGGDINANRVNPGPGGVGRQSWRQLR